MIQVLRCLGGPESAEESTEESTEELQVWLLCVAGSSPSSYFIEKVSLLLTLRETLLRWLLGRWAGHCFLTFSDQMGDLEILLPCTF